MMNIENQLSASATNQITFTSFRRLKILLFPNVLTAALCGGTAWYILDAYKGYKKIQTQDIEIINLSNQIVYLDEEKVRAIAEQIVNLSEQTGQIATVSELVGDLANQTNMLALNAAVEAARAGEHGKGFGVVASEIRKLADESRKSANKINNLVTEIQDAMSSAVMVTDEGKKTADASIELAQGTAQSLVGVKDAIESVFANAQQISETAKVQAVGIQEILASINALNLGAMDTTEGMNEVKASATQLQEFTEKLKAIV